MNFEILSLRIKVFKWSDNNSLYGDKMDIENTNKPKFAV